MDEITYTARWILPVSAPPLAHGTVSIAAGRISAVSPAGERTADIDLGNAAIVPGLVNAHTHLDLTDLRGQCPPQADFTAWLRGVIAHRRTQTPEQTTNAVSAGINECLSNGTILIGDISAGGVSSQPLASSKLRATVFFELLGLTEQRAAAAASAACAWLDGLPSSQQVKPALSPHAPYSVRHSLFSDVARLARERNIAVATHLAETPVELELLNRQTGPFRTFLEELGVWDAAGLVKSPQELIERCGPALYIHGNFLPLNVALPPGSTIVYCPRTHAAFRHPPHPLPQFLKRGIRVALGTDSLASNPDLSILEEARFVHRRFPDIPAAVVLEMITRNGAEALGWGGECGSIDVRKCGELTVVPLPNWEGNPYELILESELPAHGLTRRC